MTYSAAIALADSTLAALVAGSLPHGRSQPDATTTVDRTTYAGAQGNGYVVTVTLRTPLTETVQGRTTNTIRIVRHSGPEAHRTVADTFTDIKAGLIAALPIKLAALKSARDTALAAGFTFRGKTIQTRNETDVSNINSAALKATNDASYTTAWICADNSLLMLDAARAIAMQSAMVEAGNAIFATYVQARSALPTARPTRRRHDL